MLYTYIQIYFPISQPKGIVTYKVYVYTIFRENLMIKRNVLLILFCLGCLQERIQDEGSDTEAPPGYAPDCLTQQCL